MKKTLQVSHTSALDVNCGGLHVPVPSVSQSLPELSGEREKFILLPKLLKLGCMRRVRLYLFLSKSGCSLCISGH